MSRKDFELIAQTIRQLLPNYSSNSEQYMLFVVADELATALSRTNPRFNKARFLAACGVIK